ncbi:prohead protease/major capsid protein fusion protein [Sphingobium scionense]|uniref:HK97 family phage prohead protease n=1 Tax=Sphingobium scionense TaxID=1404341 RepID=A0A7W6PV70_9SPHN|nr:prohead protease/major capsid protein fusion protein [Sphingobium scionense]MBB4149125.1 HK97 family phage prohead protease [Sphingobium scionense]
MNDKSKVPPAPPPARGRLTALIHRHPRTTALLDIAANLIGGGVLTRNTPAEGGDPEERRQPMTGGRGNRSLAVTPDSYDSAARTVEAVLSAGSAVRRYWFTEELEISAEAIDLARVTGGICPLLDTHNQYQLDGVIGRVLSVRIEDGQLIGVLQFADTPAGRDIEARVAAGEIRAISIGYRVTKWQITATDDTDHETWRAVAWELLEASFVPVPADPNAVVRSAPQNPSHGNQEEDDMRRNLPGGAAAAAPAAAAANPAASVEPAQTTRSEPAAPAPAPAPAIEPAQRQADAVTVQAIRTAGTNAGLDTDAVFELIERHEANPFTRDALMADIGRRFAERDSNVRTANRVPASAGNGVTMARAMGDALFHRMSPGSELSADARNFRGMSLLRMAEEYLGSSGISMRGMTAHEIAERALHSTSDFPALMGNAMNRRLRAAYEENQPSYRRWARRAPNAPDFRSIDVIQTSAMPDLLKVNEAGEFKYGTISDGKVSYAVVTYGRIIGISRQTLINDDLRALERMTTGFAGSAARLENRTVYSQLTANPTMSYDTTALFHADHGNLAGAGGPISATTLGAGRTAMRLQKGLQKEELNLAPRWLIVPATQEQLAYQYTSSQYVPAKQTDTNEFRAGGRTAVEPIVESVLDAASTTAWYMAAGNEQCDTIEYTYLEGAEGVQLSSRIGFTVDGVELKASLDFAAATIDHRGLYKNGG